MMELLAWLWDQAVKVYDWFGDTYYTLRDAAQHAWDWIQTQAAATLKTAQDFAYNLYHIATNYAYGLYVYLSQQLGLLVNQVSVIALKLLEPLITWTTDQLTYLTDLWNQVVSYVGDQLGGLWDQIVGWVKQKIRDATDWIHNAYDWVLSLRSQLLNMLAVFSPAFLQSLYDFITQLYAALWRFLNDPVGFLLDMLWKEIVNFLCWAFAYALGTTIYDLPKTPTWGKGAGAGVSGTAKF